MRFQCTFCSYHMRGITDSMLGRKVRCPDCEKTNHIKKDPYQNGRILGDFIIKRRLGVGSIGAVYFATQISLDRNVALKILSKEYSHSKGIQSFLKEARSAATLTHPNLVQSFGVGEEEGVCFMAMNFIEGETVKDKIKRDGKIGIDESLHITQQVAEGLFFAWSKSGLVHRDIKPENIMLTKESAVKLTDLGLAINESEWDDEMDISGSPSYMSPEQLTGEQIDTRSDIYSLGISLYQMLTGKLPFNGATLKTVARQHFYDPPKPLNKVDPMISTKVSNLVQKMVAKEPEKRFQNMEEVIQQIWKVRQSTAPDIDLIPGVHTISMKRLDYDLQKLSKERNQHIREKEILEKKKTAVISKILYITIPVALIILFLVIMINAQKNKLQTNNAKIVSSLGKLIEIENQDPIDLVQSWKEVDSKLPLTQNNFYQELRTRMLLYKQLIINKQLKLKIDTLEKIDSAIKKNSILNIKTLTEQHKLTEKQLKKKEAELKKKEAELKQKEAELKQKEQSYKKEARKSKKSSTQLVKTHKEKNELLNQIKTLTKKYDKIWKDAIRTKIYILAGQKKFKNAIFILKSEKSKRENSSQWFNSYIRDFELMNLFVTKVESSGSKYADTITKQGRINDIIGGVVEISSESGDIKVPLNSISPKDLLPIAKDIFPVLKEENLLKLLIIMTNNIASSQKIKIKNPELNSLCEAICEYKIDRIRALYFKDEKKAKSEARDFLKEFEGIPNLNEKYKSELVKLFTN